MENKTMLMKTGAALLAASVAIAAQAEVMIEEVTVTARKRSESLQSVPDSITAFSAAQIESAGIQEIGDFAALTPNLAIYDNYRPGTARLTIRGLITPQVGDAPLAYVVDGVTAPSMDFINQDLHAVERIEVLRGPQGALYGKGAIGGAINIVTRQPTDELEGELSVSKGSGDSSRVDAFVSGPIIADKLHYRVGVNLNEQEGFIYNDFLNEYADGYESKSVSALATYTISDTSALDLRARYSENTAGVGYYSVVSTADEINGVFDQGPTANIPGSSDRELTELSSKLDFSTALGDVNWVVGYSEVSDESFGDSDYTNLPSDYVTLFAGAQETLYDLSAVTSEIRLSSPESSDLEWQIGAYYQDRTVNSTLHLWDDWDGTTRRERDSFDIPMDEYLGDNLDPGFFTEYLLSIVDENTSNAWAVFGQMNVELGDNWDLSGALRYDRDSRESFDERFYDQTVAEATFSQLQPKLQLSYELNEDVNLYASLARGFRSGGFNEPHPSIRRVFDKEVSDSGEIGVKSTLLDGRLQVNGALFTSAIDGTQYTRFNVDTFTLENLNIDETSSQGLELETIFLASENLRLTAGYGYVDAKVESFTNDPQLSGIEGNKVPGVFKTNVNLGAEYGYTLANGHELVLRADYLINGDVAWDIENTLVSPSTQYVNLRATYRFDQLSVVVYGENLGDERTPTDAFALDYGYGRQLNRPQTAGVELRYTF